MKPSWINKKNKEMLRRESGKEFRFSKHYKILGWFSKCPEVVLVTVHTNYLISIIRPLTEIQVYKWIHMLSLFMKK